MTRWENANQTKNLHSVVHARGCGAYGYFEVIRDMTDVTSADFLRQVGKRTPLFARFSTTAGEKGSPETIRDVRGMAFKMYTNEGNLDWVFLSQVRDGTYYFPPNPPRYSELLIHPDACDTGD